MKLVVSDPKSGKAFQKEVEKGKESLLMGKKVGDKIEGGIVGLDGYTLQIMGGSDKAGFPMRFDIAGSRRLKAFIAGSPGLRVKRKGERRKKVVAGNSVGTEVAQVNAKITEYGQKTLQELGIEFKEKTKEEKAALKAEKAAKAKAKGGGAKKKK
jgi:small subunit ribosomal protein S6e